MGGTVIGVDIGSGAARAVAIDRDGQILASTAARYDGMDSWEAGHADPRAWRRAVDASVTDLMAQVSAAGALEAIAIGGQSPCVVRADGSDAVTILHPAANVPDVVDAHLALADALSRGTNGEQFCQSWDWALRSLGAEPRQGRWPSSGLLPAFGSPVPTGSVVGRATVGGPIPVGTPLVVGTVDAYAAFWAAGVDTPGVGLDPGGRTGGIGIAVDRGSERPRDHGLASAAAGVDIVGGPVAGHGVIVEWWAAMTGMTVEQALASAAPVPPGADGILVLPYLDGERAPRWSSALRAEIVGLGSAAGPGHVMRAVLEGCAYGLRHIVDEAARDGARLTRLVVGGSPALSAVWNQIKADVLAVPVAVPVLTDLASFGHALAAGSALGWWPIAGDGTSGDWPTVPTTTIDPSPNAAYEEAYPRWLALGDNSVARLAERSGTPPERDRA